MQQKILFSKSLEKTGNSYLSHASPLKMSIMSAQKIKKQTMNQKLIPIKPLEKLADDPIDPPSPRALDTLCLHCQQSISVKKL